MELELADESNYNNNNNKSENINDYHLKKNNKIKQDSFNKNLFIIFLSSIILIYIINIFLFFKKVYPHNNFFYYDNRGLNVIEEHLKTLRVDPSYKGPVFPDDGIITKEWIFNLIDYMKDLKKQKANKEKYLDRVYLLKMLLKAKSIFGAQNESLIDIYIPDNKNFTVVGDIHGQFYDLLNIFEINGYPSEENPYLFNGDYIDRGAFGLECITTLIALKILYPNHVFMSRGNHEDVDTNERYGFRNEIIYKYDEKIFNCFSEIFKFLPLGHILNEEVLVIHGGLFSKDGVTIDELKKINRFQDIPKSGLMNDLLWSDPMAENGKIPSRRGAGVNFGPDITEKFLKQNHLKLLVRSHEVRMEGYSIEQGNKVITVFSAPNYCDVRGNKGAIIIFKGGDMIPNFIQFEASPHP